AFSGDGRRLIAATAEPENAIIMWDWDKERVLCVTTSGVHARTTRVSFCPVSPDHFTTSGPAHLRVWTLAAETAHKQQLAPPGREQDNFCDHAWLAPAAATTNRHPARLVAITDGESLRDEGGACILIFDHVGGKAVLELRQALAAALPGSARLDAVSATPRGFVAAGGGVHGHLAVYEHMDDRAHPYMLIKSFSTRGDSLLGLAVSPGGEALCCYARSNRLLLFQLGAVDIMNGGDGGMNGVMNGGMNGGSGMNGNGGEGVFEPVVGGGTHAGAVLSLDACTQRPVVATLGADRVIRVWNYLRWRCDVVVELRGEDPSCLGLHPAGLQLAVGLKDRVRLFHVLMDALRTWRDLPVKGARAVAYARGGHLLAVAAGFAISLFETGAMTCLQSLCGHVGPVAALQWGDGDARLFSTGLDGNVFAWDLASGMRTDELSPLGRSAPYHAIAIAAGRVGEPSRAVVCGLDGVLCEL
ncbi:unnamed protein product, partial [Phaeothamnion confervicola]